MSGRDAGRMKHSTASAFEDYFLEPLAADLRQTIKQHGYATPGQKAAEARVRMVHGLRLEREIMRGLDA